MVSRIHEALASFDLSRRWCTRCLWVYANQEASCPKCSNPEFGLVDPAKVNGNLYKELTMATTTKRKGVRGQGSGIGTAKKKPDPRPPTSDPQLLHVPLSEIRPSTTNPRRRSDGEELEQLTASIRAAGVIQPLIVRRVGQRASERTGSTAAKVTAGGKPNSHSPTRRAADSPTYELVAGERRYRAAQRAKLASVPVVVRALDDRAALEVQLLENLDREDLSAIEEATAFRLLLQCAGYTQQQLAERLGRSQGHVANRLRLLELPEEWQERIITREIAPTHARSLVPYKDQPKILEGMAEFLSEENRPSLEDWNWQLYHVVREFSRPLTGSFYSLRHGSREVAFRANETQRAELQIIEFTDPTGRKGTKEERAMNVELWDRLQKEAEDKQAERAQKRAAKGSGVGDRGSGKKADKPSAAEVRRLKERAEASFAQRLGEWKTNWLRGLCAQKLQASTWQATKLLLYLTVGEDMSRFWETSHSDLLTALSTAEVSPKRPRDRFGGVDVWANLAKIPHEELDDVVCTWLGRQLITAEGPRDVVPPDVVEGLVIDLGIDPAAKWKLGEAYLNLHNKEQLVALGGELCVPVNAGMKKSAAVALFLEMGLTNKLPAEVAKVEAC